MCGSHKDTFFNGSLQAAGRHGSILLIACLRVPGLVQLRDDISLYLADSLLCIVLTEPELLLGHSRERVLDVFLLSDRFPELKVLLREANLILQIEQPLVAGAQQGDNVVLSARKGLLGSGNPFLCILVAPLSHQIFGDAEKCFYL